MSLRQAINAMCAHCIYDKNAEGRKLEQIEACTATECPLYEVRPVTKSRESKEERHV